MGTELGASGAEPLLARKSTVVPDAIRAGTLLTAVRETLDDEPGHVPPALLTYTIQTRARETSDDEGGIDGDLDVRTSGTATPYLLRFAWEIPGTLAGMTVATKARETFDDPP
jgi:hypothetical protein